MSKMNEIFGTDQPPGTLAKDVLIRNELGLHARSAAQIAEIAQGANSKVEIVRGGEKADAASIIDMLTLSCSKGSNITVKVDSQSDIGVLNRIVALVESGFGE